MADDAPLMAYPPMMAIGPALQCHLCLDMVDIGILDSEEARPAVVVYPTKGSLCDWHRIKSVIGHIRLGPGESRERYRQSLIDEGFLPPKRVFQDVPEFVRYAANHGQWSPNDDGLAPDAGRPERPHPTTGDPG